MFTWRGFERKGELLLMSEQQLLQLPVHQLVACGKSELNDVIDEAGQKLE